ncbi:hypothetical protein LPJ73_001857 [Coemansia sp. RSA 2703]|nr:hypothetical protein LPJ73_001857 [Coemansia sp. RSA 2703]
MSDNDCQKDSRQPKKQRFSKPAAASSTEDMTDSKRAIIEAFTFYRDQLDAHYDQRERVIKISRDVTALSKKIVFSLLRITQEPAAKVFADVEHKHSAVLDLFAKMSVELQGSDGYKYNRQATPGLQEYIEALGLWIFLRDNTLISKEQVEEMIGSKGAKILVTDDDYVLGISDLPGEVNRYCINSIGKGDHEAVRNSLMFLRSLKEGINMIMASGRIRDLNKKLEVLDSSLQKTEQAYYSMSIRGSEMQNVSAAASEPMVIV